MLLTGRNRPCGRWRKLQPLGRGYAEQAKAVGQDDPRCLSEPQSCPAEVIDGPAVAGQDTAGVIEPVVGAGQVFQVSRDPMRLTQLRRAGDPSSFADLTSG